MKVVKPLFRRKYRRAAVFLIYEKRMDVEAKTLIDK